MQRYDKKLSNCHIPPIYYIFFILSPIRRVAVGFRQELVFRPSDADYAEFHFPCFHQLLAASDDGGSGGANIVDDEEVLACEVGDGVLFALLVVVVFGEVEHMPYIVLSLPAVLVCLAFHEDVSPHGVGDDGQVGLLLYASGYLLALVVTTLLDSIGSEGYGDDGVDVVEEVGDDALVADEPAHVDADVGAVTVLQGIENVGGEGVAVVIEVGAASLDGYLNPEHLRHLVLVWVFPGLCVWQAYEARGAERLFRTHEPVATNGAIAWKQEVYQFT